LQLQHASIWGLFFWVPAVCTESLKSQDMQESRESSSRQVNLSQLHTIFLAISLS
jgi:hypothetical protein